MDQSTTPSISRLLDKLDSTNAAIRRFSETGVFVEIEANSDSVVSIISEEEEVQSVIDIDEEESDTNSIIIETAEVFLATSAVSSQTNLSLNIGGD